ncbi:MAG: PaaI family thioesterase [Pseudomonadales bacterium]|nr:PaaI family thioesterase [Pseudomonadales bacterium]
MSEKTFGPFELRKAYTTEPVPADFQQRRRISAAMHTLSERLIRAEADEATLQQWAERLEALVETVGEPERRDTRAANRKLFTGAATAEDIFHMMDYDPVGGPSNPVAPQVEWLHEDQNGIEGAVRLGLQYQGPPGRVHGGVIAWLLDAALSRTLHAAFRLGVTGTLNIRYLASTPIEDTIHCRAHITGQEGRKIFVEGGIWHGDTQTVSAEGIWLTPKSLG